MTIMWKWCEEKKSSYIVSIRTYRKKFIKFNSNEEDVSIIFGKGVLNT